MSIFVGNLPFRAEQEDIIELFSTYGEVTNCALPLERDTGRKRGFAFVEMSDEAAEASAIEALQGAELMALEGATLLLEQVNAVICEVNLIENYKGGALEHEIEALLTDRGFFRHFTIYHELYEDDRCFPAWGEGLWIKK